MVRRPAISPASARPGLRRLATVAALSAGMVVAGCGGSSDADSASDEDATRTESDGNPNVASSDTDQSSDQDQTSDSVQDSDAAADVESNAGQDSDSDADPDPDLDPETEDPPGQESDDGAEVPFAPSGEGDEDAEPPTEDAGDVTEDSTVEESTVEDGDALPIDDSPPAATLLADDGNAAIVTIGETTYAVPAGQANRCSNIESMVFGSFAAGGGQAVDPNEADLEGDNIEVKVSFVLAVSNWEELGLQPPSINVDLVDEGVQWFAAADSGLGSVDSWQLSDGQATGRATFLGRNASGEDLGLVTGTFEVVCRS